ncbi:MAG: hypothetical protein ACE5EE_10960, partial [Fidelibacterota bacterium]
MMVLSITATALAVTPDIKANNSDGPVTPIDNLSVTVALDPGSRSGENADWWVAADTPFGWFYFNVSTLGWDFAGASHTDLVVTHQGPLFNLTTFEILNIPVSALLSIPGTYTVYFAIDTVMNGILDLDRLFFDFVVVNVVEPPDISSINGSVILPEGGLLDPKQLTVCTIAGSTSVDAAGGFSGLAAINEGLSQIVCVENGAGNAIAVAYLSADDVAAGNFTIGPETIALGLIRLNPFLMVLSKEQEDLVMGQVRCHPEFASLVADIENALIAASYQPLDYDTYPYIYQKAVRIGIEVFTAISGTAQFMDAMPAAVGLDKDPHIDDPPGPEITLVNPKHLFYGVHIVDIGTSTNRVTLVRGKEGIFQIWPPGWADPYEKPWPLGDGTFTITFFKGFNFSESGWFDPITAPGQATYANFLKAFGIVMPIISGLPLHLGDRTIEGIFEIMNIHPQDTFDFHIDLLKITLDKGNWRDLLLVWFPKVFMENWDKIRLWLTLASAKFITNDTGNITQFLRNMTPVLEGIAKALRGFNYALIANEAGPFGWDFIFAPGKLPYTIQQTNGVVTEVSCLIPPTAVFTVDNPSPVVLEPVTFDALGSSDNCQPVSLEVHWDFYGDGTWTSFTTDMQATPEYSSPGIYQPILEVKDSDERREKFSLDLVVREPEPPVTMPTLRIDGGTSSTKQQLEIFTFTGSNYTQNSTVTRYLRHPDGSVEILPPTSWPVDGNGNINWLYVPPCTAPTETYTLWVEDDVTQEKSNEVAEIIIANSSCTTPPTTFSASGRVTKSDGTGIPDVTMSFTNVSGTGTLPPSTQTDTNGNWNKSGFQTETIYRVTPSKPSYTFNPLSRDFSSESTRLNFIGIGTTGNQPPTAGFTMNAQGKTAIENQVLNLTIAQGQTVDVSFSAARSSDPDGSITAYEWKIDGIVQSTSRDFPFPFGPRQSPYQIFLTVTDNEGLTDSVGGQVQVSTTNQPPTAGFSMNAQGKTAIEDQILNLTIAQGQTVDVSFSAA